MRNGADEAAGLSYRGTGRVHTLVPDANVWKSANFMQRSFGERAAMNSPIQGTAADIMKIGMIRVYNRLKKELPEASLLLQIHDELLVEVPESLAEKARAIMTEEMENAAALKVELAVDSHTGRSWYEAK